MNIFNFRLPTASLVTYLLNLYTSLLSPQSCPSFIIWIICVRSRTFSPIFSRSLKYLLIYDSTLRLQYFITAYIMSIYSLYPTHTHLYQNTNLRIRINTRRKRRSDELLLTTVSWRVRSNRKFRKFIVAKYLFWT